MFLLGGLGRVGSLNGESHGAILLQGDEIFSLANVALSQPLPDCYCFRPEDDCPLICVTFEVVDRHV